MARGRGLAKRLGTTVVALAGWLAAGPAAADCYDVFGCTDRNLFRVADLMDGPTCEFLWTMRNTIFKQHGYCFATQRAIATFGNEGCQTSNMSAIRMSRIERANVATIQNAERLKRCSG